jgi:hypothetical protein
MNRLPYNLANQRSHIGQMATIATILIGVISLLGKRNELTREVFWWLVVGREHSMFFSHQKSPKCTLGGGDPPPCFTSITPRCHRSTERYDAVEADLPIESHQWLTFFLDLYTTMLRSKVSNVVEMQTMPRTPARSAWPKVMPHTKLNVPTSLLPPFTMKILIRFNYKTSTIDALVCA